MAAFPGQSAVGVAAVVAEAFDPLPADPLVWALAADMIATDPLWQLLPQYFAEAQQAGMQIRNAIDQGGQTGTPNGSGPDGKWRFKNDKLMSRHFNKHVLERGEGWDELFQMSREELSAKAQDPQSLSALQDTYQQIGRRVSTGGNYIGSEAGAQRVFFDVATRVATILQGGSDDFISIVRVVSREEFLESLAYKGLQLAPGVNLDALLTAAGL